MATNYTIPIYLCVYILLFIAPLFAHSLTPQFSLITLMWLLFWCPWVLLSTHMHIYSKGGGEVKEYAVLAGKLYSAFIYTQSTNKRNIDCAVGDQLFVNIFAPLLLVLHIS